MTDIAQEMMNTIIAAESGGPIETVRDDAGNYSMRRVYDKAMALEQMQAAGPGDYRDIYAMSQQADAPITEAEVSGTQLGAFVGVPSAVVTGVPDLFALGLGGLKAALAEKGQGWDEFQKGWSAISGTLGSEKAGELFDGFVEGLDISPEFKQGLKQGYLAGEFASMGLVAPQAAKATAGAVADYAAGAPARLEDAKSGVTLGMGVDLTQMVDEAIVGAQKALQKPTKENPVTAVPPTETEPGIIAFHGSGADFDQFSLEKIGTGEGAQAYGYGLYFTDSEDIAQFYRQTVGGGTGIVDFSIGDLDLVRSGEFRDYSPGATPFGRDRRYRRVQDLTAEDYAQASLIEDIFINEGRLYNEIKKPGAGVIYEPKKGDELKDELINIINETLKSKDPTDQPGEVAYLQNIVESVARGDATIKLDTEQYGKTYKVGLAPKPDELMDYDLSLNQQPEKIKKVLQPFYEKYGVANTADVGTLLESVKRTGAIPDDALTEKFVEAGIPGIKYRAAGSRGASVDAADAEMNYVIFDDKAIKILEKYGIVGPVAITALGAAKQESADNGA